MGVEETIRDAFTRARDYKRTWDEYREASKKDKNLIPPRRDLQLEPLVEILEGKRYVHAHSYIASEILMLINIADEFGFKIKTFQHALEGYKVAKEIAAHGAGASIFADSWAYKIEAYDAIPYNAAIMTRAGVVVSMNSDSDERARRLNIEAAKAMHWGDLTEEQALKLITLNPAIQLGIQERVGSIEVGKDADIAIWNGHPFSVYSRVDTTFIDGDVYFRSRSGSCTTPGTREGTSSFGASRAEPPRARRASRPNTATPPRAVTKMTTSRCKNRNADKRGKERIKP
jgi:imidazolonepropionase-like amidohydrolase